ncbi:MAG: hypothetical protein KJ065_09960 [Anaerolineae bacterium]|nr:hypothetical protein [Anaerolineae bacterium]
MKRIFIATLALALLIFALPAFAQDSNLITLNDATPAIDAVITLPPDTTGTISLNLSLAAVTLTDETNTTVFSAADGRLHALEFNIAPNTGAHTLTVERLPGVLEAYVSVVSLPELPVPGSAALVPTNQVSFNQEASLPLNVTSPGNTVAVNIPGDTAGLVSATFPGAHATTQLIDAQGVVVAASYNGHVDGMNLVLDGGQYDFTVLASNLSDIVVMGVRAIPLAESGHNLLEAPAPMTTVANVGTTCTASVTLSSVNLRSGPGTGYSVIDYGYRDQTFPVGGINPENNWVVIGTDSGSAWISESVARLDGQCAGLPVFNVPLRDAQPAPVIITTPAPAIIVQSAPPSASSSQPVTSSSNGEDHDEDHESEHEDDD